MIKVFLNQKQLLLKELLKNKEPFLAVPYFLAEKKE
jgi:hypothetical protein